MMSSTTQKAILALEDGSVFYGTAVGYLGCTVGEVVFNTSITGYQEILTDPSYSGQIITFTRPSIGNTGINHEDIESDRVQVSGLVIRNLTRITHHWRSTQSLDAYLKEHKTVGIADVDTRALTHILRDKGAQRGCIINTLPPEALLNYNEKARWVNEAIIKAQQCPSLEGQDLAKEVSTSSSYDWEQGDSWLMSSATVKEQFARESKKKYTVVVYDYGVKATILRSLVNHGCHPVVVPAQTPAEEVLALKPDGVVLSNGPGDPQACDYAINAVKVLLEHAVPLLGICLGCQLLALACGAKTYKMKFGQHGANHPVQSVGGSATVMITSQNHGFAVDEKTLPPVLSAESYALFDNTLQGIVHTTQPALGFQGHPEGGPGPHDAQLIFGRFVKLMSESNHLG